ncbi:MAG: hypothetical protein R6V47_01080 [Candidatus Delongbacteria bacterium]
MLNLRPIIFSLFLILISGCTFFSSVPTADKEIDQRSYVPYIEYESLKFYAAGKNGLQKKYRIYNNSFGTGSTNWVWYELIVRNMSDQDGFIQFMEIWKNEDQKILSETEKDMSIGSGNEYLEYSAGIKLNWEPGFYTLALFQDSMEIASKEFKIVQ